MGFSVWRARAGRGMDAARATRPGAIFPARRRLPRAAASSLRLRLELPLVIAQFAAVALRLPALRGTQDRALLGLLADVSHAQPTAPTQPPRSRARRGNHLSPRGPQGTAATHTPRR